jgi:murein hydrolase activator
LNDSVARRLIACLVVAMVATAPLHAQAPPVAGAGVDKAQRERRENEARAKLDALREQIKVLAAQQQQTREQRGGVAEELRERELRIAAVAKDLRVIDTRIGEQQQALDDLNRRRDVLQARLSTQRDALASLLRSAYALGRHQELKLLLQQERIGTAARVLAYHRYFQRARIARIEELLADLSGLAQVQQAIEQQTATLAASRADRANENERLQRERVERAGALDALERELTDQQARLAALGKDEKALLDLLGRLRDVFADIPTQLAGAEPFSQRRGKLPWPLAGRVASGFGASEDGRAQSGIVVAARGGTPVHAVSHGRVAYADWLKGYGLLMILDHGDGYMSLYGYNESLLKDVGDWVDGGEPIASAGSSGGRRDAGLYFELRLKGKPLDPRLWLKTAAK